MPSAMRTVALAAVFATLSGAAGLRAGSDGSSSVAPDTWRVAYNDFHPHSFISGDGTATGYAIEIVRELAAASGATVTFLHHDNPGDALRAVEEGRADIVPVLAPSPDRHRIVAFSAPIHNIRMFAYARAENAGRFGGKIPPGTRIGFSAGSFPAVIASRIEGVVEVPLASNERVLTALAGGEIDIAIYPEIAFRRMVQVLGIEDGFEVVGPPLEHITVSIAVTRREPTLLARIDDALGDLIASARFGQLRDYWIGRPTPYWTADRVARAAAIVIAALVVAATGIVLLIRFRNRTELLRSAERRVREQVEFSRVLSEKNVALDARNEEIRRLLYVMSHDLNSPLVSIGGFTRTAERHISAGRADDALLTLDQIVRNVRNMGGLISGILEFCRIGQQRPELAEIDLVEIVCDMRFSLAANLEAAGAELVHRGALPTLLADRAQIRSALQNLVENAVRHGCPMPGMRVEVIAEECADSVRIGVRDHGQGIRPEYHSRIFTLYQRLSDEKGGSGMGLAIVKKIAACHGGTAWVESAPGEGATFWFSVSRTLGAAANDDREAA